MSVVGFVDRVASDCLRGWCVDKGSLHRPCRVKLEVDGKVVVAVDADRKRADLPAAGIATEHGGFEIPLSDDLFGADVRVIAGTENTLLPFARPNKSTTILLARQRSGTNGLRSCLNTHPNMRAYNEIFHPGAMFSPSFDGNFAKLVNTTDTSLGGAFFPFFQKMMGRYGAANVSSAHAFTRLLSGLRTFVPEQNVLIDVKYNSIANIAQHWTELNAMPELVHIAKKLQVNILHLTRKNYLESHVSAVLARETGVFVMKRNQTSSVASKLKIKLDCSQLVHVLRACKEQDECVERWFSGYDKYLTCDYSEVFEQGQVSGRVLRAFSQSIGVEDQFERLPRTKKIVARRLPDICTNFGEVVRSLNGTEFEYCLKACA